MRKILVVFALCFLYAAPGLAILDLSVVGGVSQMTEPTTSNLGENYNATASTGRSYGLLAQFHSAFGLGLSVGVLYTEVSYNELVTLGSSTISNTGTLVPYYQMPVMANYWFGGILAFGAGAYYAIPGGNVESGGNSGSFAAENYNSNDYGLIGDCQIRVPLGLVTFLSVTAIYEYGLQNVSTQSSLSVRNQGFIFLAGLGIGI